MSKTITIKLTRASRGAGPFTISDQFGNIIASDVPVNTLIEGISYIVNDNVLMVTLISTGDCLLTKTFNVGTVSHLQMASVEFVQTKTACLWRHLTNISEKYNNYYGKIYPYVIEYPLSFQYQDQILQNVKDYTKVYKYTLDGTGVYNYNDKIELNDIWFNQAVVYNDQQSSGTLILVPKPKNNLNQYMSYPLYNIDSKTIIFTKSDNFYQFNSFWSVVKDRMQPLFLTTCESLSAPKLVNDDNMIYTSMSFAKSPIRAKDVKIRLELNNRSDVSLVSQFITIGTQLSYK